MHTDLFIIPLAVFVGNLFGYNLCMIWNQTDAKIWEDILSTCGHDTNMMIYIASDVPFCADNVTGNVAGISFGYQDVNTIDKT